MQYAILDYIFYTFLPQITTLFVSINYSLNFHWNTALIADETNILSRLILLAIIVERRVQSILKRIRIAITDVKMVFLYQLQTGNKVYISDV